MRSLRFATFISTAVIILISCTKERPLTPKADHHLHIRSEAASIVLSKIRGPEADTLEPTSADSVIQLLDSAGVEKGSLLSLAYFYGMPDVDVKNEYAKVRAENNYVADEAAEYPNRLYAFCSVNPMKDYALKEIRRCAQTSGFTGLKLHFGNSGVSLRNKDHVEKISQIFQEAARLELPVVVHMWTRDPEYGRKDARIFIDVVLAEVPDLPVQIAHLGGGGFFSSQTDSVMSAFERAQKNRPSIMDNDIVFDLGAAAADPGFAYEEGDTARAKKIQERNKMLANQIQQIGAEYIVFGSDWWARQPPEYIETIRSLPLKSDELSTILNNTTGYIQN